VIAATFVVLVLAGALFGFRLLAGPSLADRVVALNGLLIVGMVGIAADAVRTERGAYIPVLVVLALVGFVGTAMIARFVEGRGR
jgi:multisubunit Na+/H+ antiporter MnhF subunit